MKTTMKKTGLLLFLFGLIQISGGCIMEDRVVELVVSETTCVEFVEDQSSVSFVTPATVNYAAMLNEILDDNDISREDIVSARLVSASYGVTEFPTHADWLITGSITVQREDSTGTADTLANTLWEYQGVSVSASLGKKIPMVLNSDGVGVLNRALDDFLAGGSPVLTFRVNNSGVAPAPSTSDHLVFAWQGCIVLDIVAKADIEVPDPL
jgi:hypothetical protein